MPLTPPQKEVAQDSHRFRVCVSGRRFGKSFLARHELAKFARFPDQMVAYVAPTYRLAKTVMWRPLKNRLQDLNWLARRPNETELSLELVNGSIIKLLGSDNPDSLRGSGYNFLVLDEIADIASEAWHEVLRPTLSDTNGHALFLGTPRGRSNWSYDLFNRHQLDAAWASYSFTTLQGGNVSAEEIEQARRDLTPRLFKQEYEADFVEYGSLIAYAFTDENIRACRPRQEQEPLIVGCDFNVSPISAVIMRETAAGVEAIDEIEMMNSSTDELVQELKTRYPGHRLTAYPDPAGVQRRASANGRTDITILENAGIKCLYHRQHPEVRDRINAANAFFHQRRNDQPRFIIDPRCRRTIECLRKFSYKDGTQIPDKSSGFDHMFDGLTYAIEYKFPLEIVRPKILPQSWGAKIM